MTVIVLLPFLKIFELVRFCRLNKACYHMMQAIVNFRVLFETWGLNLTRTQWEATLISASIALQVAAKYLMLKSISKSQIIMGKEPMKYEYSTVSIPNMLEIGNKSVHELRSLIITEMKWSSLFGLWSLGFTLNNGQSCRAGRNPDPDRLGLDPYKFAHSHTFDPTKKITKIECGIGQSEYSIDRISFYHQKRTLHQFGHLSMLII